MATRTRQRLRRVDKLAKNTTIYGTEASGPYEDGARILTGIGPAPEHAVRGPAYRLRFDDGGSLVYYGDTRVIVR